MRMMRVHLRVQLHACAQHRHTGRVVSLCHDDTMHQVKYDNGQCVWHDLRTTTWYHSSPPQKPTLIETGDEAMPAHLYGTGTGVIGGLQGGGFPPALRTTVATTRRALATPTLSQRRARNRTHHACMHAARPHRLELVPRGHAGTTPRAHALLTPAPQRWARRGAPCLHLRLECVSFV